MGDPTGDRVEALLADVLVGPAELAAVVAAQRAAVAAIPAAVRARPHRRLIGMGSSGFAARDAAARWRSAGMDAAAEVASASGPAPGGPDMLAIAISSSGGTAEVVQAARRHRAEGSFVLALTSRPGSALAEVADAFLPLAAAHRESAGIASLTYRATVAALLLLDDAAGVGPPGLDEADEALGALFSGRGTWLEAAAVALDTGREVHVLGDGIRTGTTEQAALVLREAPRIAAMPFDTGDWLHVGQYTLYPGDAVLLLAGSPADAEVVEVIHRRGGIVVAVGPATPGADVRVPLPYAALRDANVRALVEPAVAELLAVDLWRRAGS